MSSVNIKPLEDKILVQAVEAETTTASGLVIPDTAKEKPQEGTVIAVGEGRVTEQGNRVTVDVKEGDTVIYSKYGGTEIKYAGERVPMDIAVGDKVIYSKYGGTEVKYSGGEYLILSARDVLAVVVR